MELPQWMLNLLVFIFFVLLIVGMISVPFLTANGVNAVLSLAISQPWIGVPMILGLLIVLIMSPFIIIVLIVGFLQGG